MKATPQERKPEQHKPLTRRDLGNGHYAKEYAENTVRRSLIERYAEVLQRLGEQ